MNFDSLKNLIDTKKIINRNSFIFNKNFCLYTLYPALSLQFYLKINFNLLYPLNILSSKVIFLFIDSMIA